MHVFLVGICMCVNSQEEAESPRDALGLRTSVVLVSKIEEACSLNNNFIDTDNYFGRSVCMQGVAAVSKDISTGRSWSLKTVMKETSGGF